MAPIGRAAGGTPPRRVRARAASTGIHLNAFTRQPFALVAAADAWTVVLSHEVLEMLADPWGNHLIAARTPDATANSG